MKKILCAILILTLFMAEAVTAYAAGPQEPTIEAQMPDCCGTVGESAIMLFTNASSPDGGTLNTSGTVRPSMISQQSVPLTMQRAVPIHRPKRSASCIIVTLSGILNPAQEATRSTVV